MRSLQRLFAIVLLVVSGYAVQAQYCGRNGGTGSGPTICTAGTTMTLPGFSPPEDSVPCVIQGVPYSQTVQVKVPPTVTSGGTTYTLNNITIDSIGNLPCGMCWATNKSSNKFNANEQFCIRISGTSYDNPGQFKMRIIVSVSVQVGPFPVTQSGQDASAAGLRFFVRVQSPSGTCAPVDTLAAGNTSLATGPAPSAAVTAGGPLTFCSGGSVTLTATATGAQYQWYRGGTLIPGATAQSYSATTAGAYTVNIVKNCVGITSATQTVTVNPAPTVTVAPVGPVIICGGSTQTLTATASGGTIQWYNGAGAISGQTGATYTASATGTYYAIATQGGCSGTSNSVSVQVSGTPPTPTVTATSASLCAGATDTLDVGAGYTTYLWSGGLGTTRFAYPTAAGTYTVTVTNGVCSGTGSFTITTRPNATTPTITPAGTVAICSGSSTTLTSSAASTYSWTGGLHTQAITVSAAGSYAVTITNVGQCGTAVSTATTVTVTTSPTAAVTPAGPVIICGSGSQLLTASGGGTYLWLKNGAAITPSVTTATYTATTAGNYSVIATSGSCSDTSNVVSVQIGSALTPTITANHTFICPGATDTLDAGSGYSSYAWSGGLGSARFAYPTAAGTYTVTVTNGACTGTATVTLNAQSATPTPTITATGSTTFCQGGSVVLTSSSATGNVWSTTATTQAITVTTGGSYTVTNNNGCGAATSTATVVTANPIPNAQITPAGSTIICGGSTQVLTATPAGSYVWLNANAPISGQTAATYTAAASGTYSAIVTVNGCSDTSNVATISVQGTPPTPVITPTAQTVCPGTIDTLNVGAGYTSYAWSGALGTNPTATVTTGGTYTVTVHNGVCVGTATITITQGQGAVAPTISVQGNLHLCGSDSVVLTSSSATGNTWSNTSTGQSITVYGAGIYFVTTSDVCGTATSLSDTVTYNTLPQVELGADTGKCAGDSISLNAGTDGTSYQWSNSIFTTDNLIRTSGEYYVSVTKNGCTNVDSIHVQFDAAPVATFTQANGVLTASAGDAYQWKKNGTPIPGATAQVYDANVQGGQANYTVLVTSGYCSATSASQLVTILGVSELSKSLSTYIYPNPTSKEITISYTLSRTEDMDVYITDMTGRIVFNLASGAQIDGEHSITTDLASLTGGVYFVCFRTEEGSVVRKVVKQ